MVDLSIVMLVYQRVIWCFIRKMHPHPHLHRAETRKKTHPEAPQWPVPPPFAILPEPGTKMMGFGDLTKNAWWIWRFFIGYWWNIWYTGIFHGIFNGIFNGIFQKGYLLEYEFSGVNGIFNGILDESFVGFLMGFNGFFNWMFMGF